MLEDYLSVYVNLIQTEHDTNFGAVFWLLQAKNDKSFGLCQSETSEVFLKIQPKKVYCEAIIKDKCF